MTIEFPKITLSIFAKGRWNRLVYSRAKTSSEEDIEQRVKEMVADFKKDYPKLKNHLMRYEVYDDTNKEEVLLIKKGEI